MKNKELIKVSGYGSTLLYTLVLPVYIHKSKKRKHMLSIPKMSIFGTICMN